MAQKPIAKNRWKITSAKEKKKTKCEYSPSAAFHVFFPPLPKYYMPLCGSVTVPGFGKQALKRLSDKLQIELLSKHLC